MEYFDEVEGETAQSIQIKLSESSGFGGAISAGMSGGSPRRSSFPSHFSSSGTASESRPQDPHGNAFQSHALLQISAPRAPLFLTFSFHLSLFDISSVITIFFLSLLCVLCEDVYPCSLYADIIATITVRTARLYYCSISLPSCSSRRAWRSNQKRASSSPFPSCALVSRHSSLWNRCPHRLWRRLTHLIRLSLSLSSFPPASLFVQDDISSIAAMLLYTPPSFTNMRVRLRRASPNWSLTRTEVGVVCRRFPRTPQSACWEADSTKTERQLLPTTNYEPAPLPVR